ncbi:signal peptidase I [Clostridium sp. SHJSY1]|uniref:signal peptidase I SipW n=1 Tax=Clostridium sp. SHJSY1 TaxID=2942483 RepID=UPI00287506E5|nr:signal peptidase I [Clostridium sp. SHJSY1]MDS0527440.1 signal peptidase I [Clostridium sp. SHJSY1]
MKIKKWISNIISIVIMTMFILVVVIMLSSKIYGGKPKVFGYELLTVLSGSMEPSIKTGSIIAVKPISTTDKCDIGDVVTYQSLEDTNTLITHRITDVENTSNGVQYITKGDNNDSEDPNPIPSTKVVATYANFTIPGLGYIFNFIKSKNGIICLLIIPGMLLIISQLINMWKVITKVEEEKKVGEAIQDQSSKNV